MKIALDAMGGDHAPMAPVEGALQAIKDFGCEILLVGDEQKIKACLGGHGQPLPEGLSILHTDEAIAMNESPTAALRQKKKASVALATEQVRSGAADAIISAGNTGALLEAAVLGLGRLKGIKRPAIVTPWPTESGTGLLLDAGANSDNRPEHLLQFAIMGSVYAEKVLGLKSPRVGFLNIGKETNKGNLVILDARELMENAPLNFVGNVEPMGFLEGEVDVAVCDGFVGNMVLKTGEAVAERIFSIMKEEFTRSLWTKMAAMMLKPALKGIKARLDHTEYGGAPFLGVNGICLKSHGRANARAIRNAIKAAIDAHKNGTIPAIVDALSSLVIIQSSDDMPKKDRPTAKNKTSAEAGP